MLYVKKPLGNALVPKRFKDSSKLINSRFKL